MASAYADGGESGKAISPMRARTASEEETIKGLQAAFVFEKDLSGSTDSLNSKKTVLIDEDRFIERFLRCLICQELFDDNNRPPKILPCHHSLCILCVLQIFKTEAEYRRSFINELPHAVTIICPTCKNNFISTEAVLRGLPTDHRIIQLIDFLGHTERYVVNYCQAHTTKPLNFFCESCSCLVCRSCTVEGHIEGQGHVVVDIEGGLQKYAAIIEKAISTMTAETKDLKETKMKVETAVESLDSESNKVVQQIHDTFSKLRKILDEREKEVINIAESQFGSEKSKLTNKIEEIDKRCNSVNEKVGSLQQGKDGTKIEEVYKLSQNVQGYKPEPAIQIKDLDDGTVTKITFNDKEETFLSQKLQNYGDIVCQIEGPTTVGGNDSGDTKTSSLSSPTSSSSPSSYSSNRYASRYSSSSGNHYTSSGLESRYTGSSYTGSYTGNSRYGTTNRYGYNR